MGREAAGAFVLLQAQPARVRTPKPQRLELLSVSKHGRRCFSPLSRRLSGAVLGSQSSVINCHNASKLTNGLRVKEGPLIYQPPAVDPEPIISITRAFMPLRSLPPTLVSRFAHISGGLSRSPFASAARWAAPATDTACHRTASRGGGERARAQTPHERTQASPVKYI